MRKFALASCAAALLLGACSTATNDVTAANNALFALAPTVKGACVVVGVAEGYYATIVGTPAPAVATAEAAIAAICANPPTNLAAAFATLLQEWTIIQAATVTPAAPVSNVGVGTGVSPIPTPTPTP